MQLAVHGDKQTMEVDKMDDKSGFIPTKIKDMFDNYYIRVDDDEENTLIADGVCYFWAYGSTDRGRDIAFVLSIKHDELGEISAWRKTMFDVVNDFSPWEKAIEWCGEHKMLTGTDGDDLYLDFQGFRNDCLEEMYYNVMRMKTLS